MKGIKICCIITCIIFSIIFISARTNTSFHCPGTFITLGMHSYKIIKECGKPKYKEIISTTECIPRIEHWIYGPKGGYYYCLIFVNCKLIRIESFR